MDPSGNFDQRRMLENSMGQADPNLQQMYYNNNIAYFQQPNSNMNQQFNSHINQLQLNMTPNDPRRMSFQHGTMNNMLASFSNVKNENNVEMPSPREGDFNAGVTTSSLVQPISIMNRSRGQTRDSWDDISPMFNGMTNPNHATSPPNTHNNMISPVSEDFYDSGESVPSLSASFGGAHSTQTLSNPRLAQRPMLQHSFSGDQFDPSMYHNNVGFMSMSVPNNSSQTPNQQWSMHPMSGTPVPMSASQTDSVSGMDSSFRNIDNSLEKKLRRKANHNKVERKRRDNINEKIQELGALLPSSMINTKPHKGEILTQAVTYLKQVRELMRQTNPEFSMNENLPIDPTLGPNGIPGSDVFYQPNHHTT